MILWKISFREIRSHFWRAFLTVASIVIGVAAVVAVNQASVAVRASFGAMQETISGAATLQVLPAGDANFDEGLADQLTDIPGVKGASPIYERATAMLVDDKEHPDAEARRIRLMLLGVDPKRDDLIREYKLAEGRNLKEGDEVVLDASFASGLRLKTGDEVRLLTGTLKPTKMTVVGLLKPATGAAVGRGSVLFMPLATVQSRFKVRGKVNQVQIVLEEKADPDAVKAAIEVRLPVGLTVRSTASQSQMGEETMLSLQKALTLATLFSLVAAIFIVGNAFSMNVAQRHRQMAVMRAIGATRLQIFRLIIREASLMALLGTILGIALGWGGAVLLSYAMGELFLTDLPAPELSVKVLAIAAFVGLGVPLLGAFVPAFIAARVEPVEGMHEISRGDVEGVPKWIVRIGAVRFFLSAAMLAAILGDFMPPATEIEERVSRLLTSASIFGPGVMQFVSYWSGRISNDYVLAALVLLVFTVPLFPLALESLARLSSYLLRPFGRAEARIARQQLLRRRVRTTLTIGVLFIASSMGLGLASTVMDNINDVRQWYGRVMAGDFFLRVMTPDLSKWDAPQLPDGVEEKVRAIPGIQKIFGVRFLNAYIIYPGQTEPQKILITARDFPSADTIQAEMIDLTREEMFEKMHEGYVTIGSVLAQRSGLKSGDKLTILTEQGPKEMPIAGTINDYMGGGLVAHMDREWAAKWLGVTGADAFVVRTKEEDRERVGTAMKALADENGLLFQSYAELTGEIDAMMAGVIGGLWVVMILGLVVASLGVTNTLSMNVLEQTRELAMLRVVAMTRQQARRTIMDQAAILGSIGLTPGIILGLGVSWLLNRSLPQATGHAVAFGVHYLLGAGGLCVALVLVVLAAWLPAQRAANLEPIQALRYE